MILYIVEDLKMEKIRITFSVLEKVNIDLAAMAKGSGVSKNLYIAQVVEDSLYGRIIPRPLLQQCAIELMRETQVIKDKYPDVDLSGVERVGNELCRL